MARLGRNISACGVACLVIGGCISGCGGTAGGGDAAVARVGTVVIAKRAVDHWAAIDTNVGASPAVRGRGTRASAALGFLISAQWTLGEAARLGIGVSTGEAHGELELFKASQPLGVPFAHSAKDASFVDLIGRVGETDGDMRWLMRLNLLADRIEQRRLRTAERGVGAAEIVSYYTHHKRRFVVPEERDLEVLGSYQKAVVVKAKREIRQGANFIAVAKRVSSDGEAPEGVQLHLRRGEEEPHYEAHVFSGRPGVLYGPVRQDFYYLFEVLAIRPTHVRTLAQADGSIRSWLVAARRNDLLGRWRADEARRWRAQTYCHAGYVLPQCRQ